MSYGQNINASKSNPKFQTWFSRHFKRLHKSRVTDTKSWNQSESLLDRFTATCETALPRLSLHYLANSWTRIYNQTLFSNTVPA